MQVIGFAVDITAGKRAEMLLKESEERYRQIFETCAEGILVAILRPSAIQYANPAMCGMLGYTLKGLLQKSLTPPSNFENVQAFEEAKKYFAEIATGNTITGRAIPCRHKDGSITLCEYKRHKDEH